MTGISRLVARLSTTGVEDRLPRFLWPFAVYLVIRGAAYEDLRLLIPCALLLPFDRTRRWGALLALVVEAALFRRYLPLVGNHGLLEAWLWALLAVMPGPRARPAERASLVRLLMVALVTVLLWTGVQKALHGYFPAGDYFTVEVAQPGKFAERLSWLLPEDERVPLERYRQSLLEWAATAPGGSVSPAPPPAPTLAAFSRLACWSTLLAELILPWLLLPRRTRPLAALALTAFFVGVEAAADEWHFALLVAALMLLFAPERLFPRALRASGDAPSPPPPERPRPSTVALAGAALLVTLLALWPACHYALTLRTGLNPWKLGGFAMYAVPGPWDRSRLEVRPGPASPWRLLSKRDPGAPRAHLDAQEDILKNTPFDPFAASAVRRIGELSRPLRPPGSEARVRSRVVVHDRAAGAFRLVERIYPIP